MKLFYYLIFLFFITSCSKDIEYLPREVSFNFKTTNGKAVDSVNCFARNRFISTITILDESYSNEFGFCKLEFNYEKAWFIGKEEILIEYIPLCEQDKKLNKGVFIHAGSKFFWFINTIEPIDIINNEKIHLDVELIPFCEYSIDLNENKYDFDDTKVAFYIKDSLYNYGYQNEEGMIHTYLPIEDSLKVVCSLYKDGVLFLEKIVHEFPTEQKKYFLKLE